MVTELLPPPALIARAPVLVTLDVTRESADGIVIVVPDFGCSVLKFAVVAVMFDVLKSIAVAADECVMANAPGSQLDVREPKLNVTAPVDPDTPTPEPATADVTPLLVMVTAPVDPDTPIPVPATADVTPLLVIVSGLVPVMETPVPPENSDERAARP